MAYLQVLRQASVAVFTANQFPLPMCCMLRESLFPAGTAIHWRGNPTWLPANWRLAELSTGLETAPRDVPKRFSILLRSFLAAAATGCYISGSPPVSSFEPGKHY
ncbi:MAG: hypothetical protein ACRD52_16655 [Candidatus Acidiferrales bacterium]